MNRGERAKSIAGRLAEMYPDADCDLDFRNPWELLVATVLSAQCTDKRVNQVTPTLFSRWLSPVELAEAPREEIEEVIRSTGFFRNKARALQETSRTILADHGGVVPSDLGDLVALAGVGRKTAKVVLGVAFGISAGIVVDTHVGRLARRFGLSRKKDPEKVAADLEALLPREDWIAWSHRVIRHGRRVCSARRPDCGACTLIDLCRRVGVSDG